MSRFFTISLLLLGLGLAAYDGFQTRQRANAVSPAAEQGTLSATDGALLPTGGGSAHATDGALLPTN